MRTWIVRALKSSAWRRPVLCSIPCITPSVSRIRSFSSRTYLHEHREDEWRNLEKFAIFRKIERPTSGPDAWIALLDGALPPHLRDWEKPGDPPILSAFDVAEILLAAQYPRNNGTKPYDLLYHLALEHGRWNAVIWLVKSLVEQFPLPHVRHNEDIQTNDIWQSVSSFEHFTSESRNAVLEAPALVPAPASQSLEQFTDVDSPEEDHSRLLGRHALGQVWRTLGEMTKDCAGSDIRPEILEIIAYLHHKEIMPMSIYQFEHQPDRCAIQQPPLLSILSSRILTSLSDAAWRAHEKLVIEEAKANGSEYAALRPEVPGSVYRINVAGLRPELWMELILWSCIQGGWIYEGIEILLSIARTGIWKPLSWREYEKTIPETGHTSAPEWFQWEHAFKTRAASQMDPPRRPVMDITRAVSAEIVNAYIDALANRVNTGFVGDVMTAGHGVPSLRELKAFLHQEHPLLDLSFGSWDALVVRLLESSDTLPERDFDQTGQLVSLSDGFASGVYATNNRDQPAYVRDGNMAMQGLLHRALYGQIAAENLSGALEVFKYIQNRADADKTKSLAAFMQRSSLMQLMRDDIFTSNYSGIEYPAFSVQVPPSIMGSFLELVTDAKEFDFGRWLLYNNEVDGPVIREASYKDPFIQPAVIRFAVVANDQNLLAKFRQQRLRSVSFYAVFDTQVNALQWDAASRVLDSLADSEQAKWSIKNLSNVARMMLKKHSEAINGDADNRKHSEKARSLCRDMYLGKYHGHSVPKKEKRVKMQNVLSVLSAVDEYWAKFCSKLLSGAGHTPFLLQANEFNILLEGVVAGYGAAAGRRLLDRFWPRAIRSAYEASRKLHRDLYGGSNIPPRSQALLQRASRQRINVACPRYDGDDYEIISYGALIPNVNTILIIVRKALEEIRPSTGESEEPVRTIGTQGSKKPHQNEHEIGPGHSTSDIVRWAIQNLAELPVAEGSIVEQLESLLTEYGIGNVRKESTAVLKLVEAGLTAKGKLRTLRTSQSAMNKEIREERR